MAEAKKAGKAKKSEEKPKSIAKNTKAEEEKEAAVDTAKAEKPTKKTEDKPKTTKAGKRSAKAVAEAEEKTAKEERKKESKPDEAKTKPQQKPPRSRLERRGKNYRKNTELVDKKKSYSLAEALKLACETASTKFGSTVELHLRLNVDPKQSDQNIRDSVVLPAGTGKSVRVAVFCDESNAKKAKAAGADVAGEQEILSALDKEQIEFDTLIAMPNMMVKLAKYARILGPKGLMPNPKSGTVTADVAKAVEQAKAGKIEYRVDGNGIIHVGAGKVSFGEAKLKQNADELISSIKQNKPSSIKGAYIRSFFVTTTMGPSIMVDIAGI